MRESSEERDQRHLNNFDTTHNVDRRYKESPDTKELVLKPSPLSSNNKCSSMRNEVSLGMVTPVLTPFSDIKCSPKFLPSHLGFTPSGPLEPSSMEQCVIS